MECEQIRDAMLDILSDDAPKIPAEDVQRHLKECRGCLGEAGDIVVYMLRMNRLFASFSASPPGLEERLIAGTTGALKEKR
jgi:predicted anti-sigma-YlaC factor YlaD